MSKFLCVSIGNMWSQTWNNVYDMMVPYPGKPNVDVTDSMVAKVRCPRHPRVQWDVGSEPRCGSHPKICPLFAHSVVKSFLYSK